MSRAAVYCGTKNLYKDMLTAAKSLMVNSSVEKIYFMIEDDKFPYLLPPCIKCINVKNQQYFKPDSPNFHSSYTYMALIRAALTKELPDEDLILSLDVDTIIDKNIDELWTLDMSKYYIAAAREHKRSTGSYLYINFGVCLINLKLLRETKLDDKMIYCLNRFHYNNDVQDCYSDKCQGRILELPSKYNAGHNFCRPTEEKLIIHYAGLKKWQGQPEIIPYRNMPMAKVEKLWKENLDNFLKNQE